MAVCPSCKENVPDSAANCPKCGERIIPADTLEKIPTKTSNWQKVVIAVSVILLVAIGFTFQGAEERENKAAQSIFQQSMETIIRDIGNQVGVNQQAGMPKWILKAETKGAQVAIDFPAPLTKEQASAYGQGVCAALAQAYVRKGYMPRHIAVTVGNGQNVYGQAIFNGNINALGWEGAE